MDLVELVTREELERLPGVQKVPSGREESVWDGQLDAGAVGEVDQAVTQAEVQQRVFPRVNPRRRKGRRRFTVAGRRGGLHGLDEGAVRGGTVLDHGDRAVVVPRTRRKRENAGEPGLADVGDADQRMQVAGQVGGGGRAVCPVEWCRFFGRREHRGLDQPDQPEIDQVDDVGGVGLRGAIQGQFVPPVSEEGVTVDHPQQRPNAGLLQGGRHDDDRVQAGCDSAVQDVAGCADFLPDLGPAGGRLCIADLPSLHRLVDRSDDRVHTLGSGLVALDGRAAGALLEDVRRLRQQLGDRRVVRHDERRQHLQRQQRGRGSPMLCGQEFDRRLVGGESTAVVCQRDADGRGAGLLDLKHGGRVGDEADIGQDQGALAVEVDEEFAGLAEGAVRVADLESERGTERRRLRCVDGDAVDHRDPVVRHRVAQGGCGHDIDADRRVGVVGLLDALWFLGRVCSLWHLGRGCRRQGWWSGIGRWLLLGL